jgi:hypothetical protein
MSSQEDVVRQLQKLATEGESPARIVGWLHQELGENVTAFSLIHHLFLAFKVPLSSLREVEDWSGLGRGGKLSDHELNDLLRDLVPRDAPGPR